MLEVTLNTVLLVVLLLDDLVHNAAQLIDRIIKLPVQIASLDREETPNQSDSVELFPKLSNLRHCVVDKRRVSPHWLPPSEALKDVLHKLLLPFHRDDTRLQQVKVDPLLLS